MIKVLCSAAMEKSAREDLALKLSKGVAKTMNKPEPYVQAIVEDGATIAFAGSIAPSAFVVVRGIGGFNPDVNKALSKVICEELREAASVDPSKTYINFESLKPSDWGWNCGTF
jgi:phenylpyruvate tautomerase PptA (4-oxalocrotonate tautomerase family)